MAISGAIVWEVLAAGSDLNGGGFKTGAAGTNYAQQTGAQKSGADLAMHATTANKVNPAGAGVAAADVGNVIYIASGTDWTPGWYEITAQDGTYWTLSTSHAGGTCSAAGNANAATYKMGGAFASPGILSTVVTIHGQKAWIGPGTYTLASATAGTTGPIVLSGASNYKIEGWQSTRGDLGTKPIITVPANDSIQNIALVTLAGNDSARCQTVINLKVDGKNGGTGTGINGFNLTGSYNAAVLCDAINCDQANTLYGFSRGKLVSCLAQDCGVGFTLYIFAFACEAYSCNANGFVPAVGRALYCISRLNGGVGFLGTWNCEFVNCMADGNAGDGFDAIGNTSLCINCISSNHTTYGFDAGSGVLIRCAGYNNGNNVNGTPVVNIAFKTLTSDPYTERNGDATEDFRPNTAANGGALLRAAGLLVPSQQANGNLDIGAVQHADPAGGGGRPEFRGANL
jgi:hypothetical protein